MSESLDLLDDIGLVLSVFVLFFISYFHLRALNDDRTWDRKMGASLVIWLLLYFILRRMQDIVPETGIQDPDVAGWIVEITAYSSSLNFYYIHLVSHAVGAHSLPSERLADWRLGRSRPALCVH